MLHQENTLTIQQKHLHEVATKGERELVELMGQIRARQKYLYQDIEKGDANSLPEYLQIKEDLNARDKYGRTILHLASLKGWQEAVGLLLEAGVDVNPEDNNKETPLHAAAASKNPETVALLVKNNAKVNVKNKYDKTPLHVAAFWDSPRIVGILLEGGADKNSKDKKGRTPYDMIKNQDSVELLTILDNNDRVNQERLYDKKEKESEKVNTPESTHTPLSTTSVIKALFTKNEKKYHSPVVSL